MIFIERGTDGPASLSSAATLAQASASSAFYATWSPGDAGFEGFSRYREYDVQDALRALFHGKCAYCETFIEKGTAAVEHYRPKAAVEGCDHPGYWWLAFTWSNLLPTCNGCNQGLKQHVVTEHMTKAEVEVLRSKSPIHLMGKATQFPVGKKRLDAGEDDHFGEEPHLIDPTRTNPAGELAWHHHADFSVVQAAVTEGTASILGAATVHCVALNRLGLVQSRTAILNKLKTNRIKILSDLESDLADDVAPGLLKVYFRAALRRVDDMKSSTAPDQPFSAMAKSFIDAFEAELVDMLRKKAELKDEIAAV